MTEALELKLLELTEKIHFFTKAMEEMQSTKPFMAEKDNEESKKDANSNMDKTNTSSDDDEDYKINILALDVIDIKKLVTSH